MTRTSNDEVKAIIETSVDPTPFIETASHLIDEHLMDSGYSEERLRQIEMWLSAHFVCIRDPRVKSQKVGDAQDSYQVVDGEGLGATSYGQQVMLLDTNGILADLYKPKVRLECI